MLDSQTSYAQENKIIEGTLITLLENPSTGNKLRNVQHQTRNINQAESFIDVSVITEPISEDPTSSIGSRSLATTASSSPISTLSTLSSSSSPAFIASSFQQTLPTTSKTSRSIELEENTSTFGLRSSSNERSMTEPTKSSENSNKSKTNDFSDKMVVTLPKPLEGKTNGEEGVNIEEKLPQTDDYKLDNNKQNQSNNNMETSNLNSNEFKSNSYVKNLMITKTGSFDETDKSSTSDSSMKITTDVVNNNSIPVDPPLDKTKNQTYNEPNVSDKSVLAQTKYSEEKAETARAEISSELKSNENDTKKDEVIAPGKKKPTPEQSAAIEAVIQSLINYNEGQWSPQNPTGKKQYDRDQLMQLRDAKASRVTPDVSTINASILPQPNLLPSFMRSNNNKRVQSMSGIPSMNDRSLMGNNGNVTGSNYSNKQSNSARGSRNAGEVFHINLSLNQDVKLNETDNAWRPRQFGSNAIGNTSNTHDSEELKRNVRGILNKLTPEKFDILVEQVIKLKIDTFEKVNDVMELVFEKAIDEPNFSVSYARLCQRLVDEVKARDSMESGTRANLKQFRTSLLDKTEKEFNENVAKRTAKEQKLQPLLDKIRDCKDPAEKLELQAQLEDEERKIRRRSGGTVRFIGELFKISMLTGKIIDSCINLLLKAKSEDQLECLCKLLTTVGEKFEKTLCTGKEYHNLDDTMKRMQAIASKTDKDGLKVTSRVRFMLQDVIDLRNRKWVSTRVDTPKTMEEIQKQAKTEQMSSQYMNYSSMMSGSGGGNASGHSSDRGNNMKKDERRYGGSNSNYGNNRDGSRGGRNDDGGSLRRQNQGGHSMIGNGSVSNNGDDTWHHVQTGKGNRSIGAVDTNKLESMLNHDIDMGTKKMGNLQQFLWNSSGGQSRATASNSFAALSNLMDNKSNNERSDRNDRNDRNDRGGNRNKGSYNKGSIERDRYDRGISSRGGSAHGSRESSSSRNNQARGIMNSLMQKVASHNKNQYQSLAPRMSTKQQQSQSSTAHSINSSSSLSNKATEAPVEYESQTFPLAVFVEPTNEEKNDIKSAISEMVEVATNLKTLDQVIPCLTKFKDNLRSYFLFLILAEYLHLANVGHVQRRYIANIVAFFFQRNYISLDNFKLAYEHFCELASDLIIDIPDLWMYIFQFAGPLMRKNIITLEDIWTKDLAEQKASLGPKFLQNFLVYSTRHIGPQFTRNLWKKSKLNWTDFLSEADVSNFIQANKFEFIEKEAVKPPIFASEEKGNEKIHERVEHLLKDGCSVDEVIDFMNGSVAEVDKQLIRSLTTTICNHAIVYKDGTYKLDSTIFKNTCIPLMERFINSDEQCELESLYAMQLLCNCLEHPRGLLIELFGEFYDADIIQKDTFLKWRDSKEESLAGKGVAVKGLNPFFTNLLSNESDDEDNN